MHLDGNILVKYVKECYQTFGSKLGKKLINHFIGGMGVRFKYNNNDSIITDDIQYMSYLICEYGNDVKVDLNHLDEKYYSVEMVSRIRKTKDLLYIIM